MAAKKNETTGKRITSLADMAGLSTTYDVEIEYEGDVLVFPCKMLSYSEWQAAEMRVPNPVPPVQGVDKAGRPVFDKHDPGYQVALLKARDLLIALRVAAFLQIDIDGDTPEAQAQVLMETLPPAVIRGLVRVLDAAYEGRAARVLARAETFRPDGETDAEGVEGA